VIRHVDAGYELAETVADAAGVRVPMREGAEARDPGVLP
jgi:Urocanate hydratase